MSEYIKREDAIATMRRLFDMRHGIAKEYVELYADMIENLEPIDIVHCKDCKHFYADAECGQACELTEMRVEAEDYCSYGER